jgi:hypothetical protein
MQLVSYHRKEGAELDCCDGSNGLLALLRHNNKGRDHEAVTKQRLVTTADWEYLKCALVICGRCRKV